MANDHRAIGPLPVQGTRASVPMGHAGGPKQPPTATAFGDGPTVPNTQSAGTQVRGWPPNPVAAILPTPGARESQTRTDSELQTQPAPGRILRQLYHKVFGNIGESGHAFPFDGGFSFVPHLFVPRVAQRTGPMRREWDDNTPIPAIYAGNPRRG